MAKYRKKVVEVEAVKWDESNVREIHEMVFSNHGRCEFLFAGDVLIVRINGGKSGNVHLNKGDYIARANENGEYFQTLEDCLLNVYEKV